MTHVCFYWLVVDELMLGTTIIPWFHAPFIGTMVLPGNDRFKIVNDHIEQCLVSIHGDLPEQGSAEFVLQDVVKLDTHQFIVVEGYELSTIHPSVRLSVCPTKSVRFLGFVPKDKAQKKRTDKSRSAFLALFQDK